MAPASSPVLATEQPQVGGTPGPGVPVLFVGYKPTPARFAPVRMTLGEDDYRPVGKPHGGLWTCRDESWVRFSQANLTPRSDPRRRVLWRLRVRQARLLVLDSTESLVDAYRRYPSDYLEGLGLRSEIVRATPAWHFRMPELDHEKIAAEYDGLEVTARGLREAHTLAFPDTDHWLPLALSGWDVPCVLWYRWVFNGPPERVTPRGA